MSKPKILFIDIETKPLLVWAWGLFDQNIGLDQIEDDWRIISFAAKWADSKKVIQADLRSGINDLNEKYLVKKIWQLFDEADIIVGQNSKKFDVKKINEQFLKYKLGSPSPYRQEDTLTISKKHFSPTSHKLEYRSKQLNAVYKKLSHSKYPGFGLWKACIHGDKRAWIEMAKYNIFDVLSTEEYFNTLKPWGSGVKYAAHDPFDIEQCDCGNAGLQKRGFNFSNTGKFQRYFCKDCGSWSSGKLNLLTKDKRKSLLK